MGMKEWRECERREERKGRNCIISAQSNSLMGKKGGREGRT